MYFNKVISYLNSEVYPCVLVCMSRTVTVGADPSPLHLVGSVRSGAVQSRLYSNNTHTLYTGLHVSGTGTIQQSFLINPSLKLNYTNGESLSAV